MQKHLSVLAVIVTALALPFIAFAQIEKGKFVVGGEIHYDKRFYPTSEYTSNSTSFKEESKSRSFSSLINVGYMISGRFEVGFFLNYADYLNSSESFNSQSNRKYKHTNKSLGIGPSIRYYQPILERLYFFGQLQSGIYKNEYQSSSSDYYKEEDTLYWSKNTRKYSSISANLSPGINYMPLKWLSFEALLGGIGWSQNESGNTDFNFNLNLRSLYIGTRLFF